MNNKSKTNKGITLIALIITVIVLLILAGTAISIAINGGDIFGKASQARESWNTAVATEQEKIDDVMSLLNTITDGNGGGATPTPAGITMTLDGVQVTGINQTNFAQHLGKVVTNYTNASTGKTSAQGATVSTTYRLYWIDWTNKYGDGTGTIYLKADCTNSHKALLLEELTSANQDTDRTTIMMDKPTSILRKLNPELYKGIDNTTPINPPEANSNNMKAVRWLTNPSNWSGLINDAYSAKTNYIVGAPSLEMMMDSYNEHYGLTGDTPDYSDITAGTRRKIFYTYPLSSNNYGYGVGPNADDDVEYSNNTSDNSVYTDSAIDSMYYPGSGDDTYWLASPSDNSYNDVMYVSGYYGGIVYNDGYSTLSAFCPLVSLQSDVQL